MRWGLLRLWCAARRHPLYERSWRDGDAFRYEARWCRCGWRERRLQQLPQLDWRDVDSL